MYYPRKIPEHFLKNTAETAPPVPLTAREQITQSESIFPTAVLLLALYSISKKQ